MLLFSIFTENIEIRTNINSLITVLLVVITKKKNHMNGRKTW